KPILEPSKDDLAAAAKKAVLKEQSAAAAQRLREEADAKRKAEEHAKAEAERQRLAALQAEQERVRKEEAKRKAEEQAKLTPTRPAAPRLEEVISLLQDTEIVGRTRTFAGEQPSLDACSKKCHADAACQAFSFNKTNRFCYLVDGVLYQESRTSF